MKTLSGDEPPGAELISQVTCELRHPTGRL
jgi:hypothetical protein